MATLENSLNFEDFQKLLTKPYVKSALSSANVALNEFYLGPSINDVDSVG